MEKDWNLIEVLRHSRHDWLNKIQLIKGNLDLNKPERAKAIIEEIIIETQAEAMLSQLNMPLFAECLLISNWLGYPFKVEYEIMELEKGCPNLDNELNNWTKSLFSFLNSQLEPYMESVLTVSISIDDNNACFLYEVQGIIKSTDSLHTFIFDNNESSINVKLLSISENTTVIEVSADCLVRE